MFEVGETLGGKYRIEHQIARGGMGTIVAATHVKLGIKVAIKFLREDTIKDRRLVDRFINEAQAAAQLRSEHVCRVSDVEITDAGIPYIVMELLQGRDLQTVLKTAPLDVPTAASYVLQACQAIAEAHAIGIVHRDIKPANLFLTYGPNGAPLIKVLDFGVAKAPPKLDDHGMTQTQTVMGSPGYMSPEQLRSSRTVDARTDIWSVGVALYELVVGKRPWTAEAITELTLKVANDPMPPMPATIPKAFSDVVERCLRKEPKDRFPDIVALAAALAPFASNGDALATGVRAVFEVVTGPIARPDTDVNPTPPTDAIAAAPPTGAPQPPTPPTTSPPTTLRTASGVVEPDSIRSRRFPVKLVAFGASVLVIAIVAFTAFGGDGSSPEPRATASQPPPTQPATIDAGAAASDLEPDEAIVEAQPDASVTATTARDSAPIAPAAKPTAKKPPTSKPNVKKRSTIEDVRDSRE